MPVGRPQDNWLEGIARKLFAREQEHKEEALLPEDFTGQVYLRAREQAAVIRARLDAIAGELGRIEAEIRQIRRDVFALSEPATIPARRRGDILTQFFIEPAREDPNFRQKGQRAIEVQKQLGPLETYRARLMAEQQGRLTELADLRRIATLAGDGSPAVIAWLAGRWSSTFGFGAGMNLPKPAKLSGRVLGLTDAAGYFLPKEALDAAGEPDLPRLPKAGGSGNQLPLEAQQ